MLLAAYSMVIVEREREIRMISLVVPFIRDSESVLYRIEPCSDSAAAVVAVVLVTGVGLCEVRTNGQAGCSRLGLAPPEFMAAAIKPISKELFILGRVFAWSGMEAKDRSGSQ